MPNALTMIKPHEVSRDLSGYSVLFYGTPKSGKTTIASHFPKSLVFAFEKGYSAIPGIMAIPVNSWREFRSFLMDLREDETKEMYKTVVIDTADIAWDYCTDYVCQQNGVSKINDIPYGGGYALAQREFDTCIRKILQMDYGLVLISHSKEKTLKDEQGNEYDQIMPTLENKARLVCERTCDIIGMCRPVKEADGSIQTRLFLRETPRYVAGSRFKYIVDSIPFTYENLVKAITDAIEKEAQETGNKYVTATKANLHVAPEAKTYDFKALIDEFQTIVGQLMSKSPANRSKISGIVAEYLGGEKKVGDCTEDDAPQLDLILQELRTLV